MKILYMGTAAKGWPGLFCSCPICSHARKEGGQNLRARTQALLEKLTSPGCANGGTKKASNPSGISTRSFGQLAKLARNRGDTVISVTKGGRKDIAAALFQQYP